VIAEEIVRELRRALERDDRSVDAGDRLEQFGSEIAASARRRCADIKFAPACFAIATTSPIVFAGNEGCAGSTTGIDAISPIGAKSLRGSKPAFA